jgi:hypothetical protein
VNVYISDPRMLTGVQSFLRHAGCVAEQRRSHELEVYTPGVPEEQARRELNVYLASWQALNPGVETYIIESDPEPSS